MFSDFLICDFAKETLSNLVKERFGSEFPDINSKDQVKYLYRYLSSFKAKSILIEPDYVDRDFLEDYSRYYVKCFNQYGDRCARLHFFSEDIDHSSFQVVLDDYSDKRHKELQEAYIGFIVVKPLPKTFIGKTCLRIYDSFIASEYKKVINHRYNVNLFGLNFHVDTVAFQEQDKVVSACATTAIWSALHALDKNDIRSVPSSSEITLSAINHVVDSYNSFPNKGLTNKQILRSLDIQKFRNHKLNIDLTKSTNSISFFKTIKSYLQSDIPIILGTDVYWQDESDQQLSDGRGHAVTILGYKEKDQKYLYIHDDRIGPYVRVRVCDNLSDLNVYVEGKSDYPATWGLIIEEINDSGEWQSSNQALIPDSLIIPNYKKINIPSSYIENTCNSAVDEYNQYWRESVGDDVPNIDYEITLISSATYKSEILKNASVKNKKSILLKPLAKYIWVATFTNNSNKIFDILFDSTEIPQGNAVSEICIYDEDGYTSLKEPLINLHDNTPDLDRDKYSEKDFLISLIRFFQPKKNSYFAYLDSQFGAPRAPKKIHKSEILNNNLLNQDAKSYYGKNEKHLEDDFPELKNDNEKNMIWVISLDGGLRIGKEENGGHPTLTGFKPARIAGELRYKNNKWEINAKSGRYSIHYSNSNELLKNAKNKFLEIYSSLKQDELDIQEYFTDKVLFDSNSQ